jgi:ArsR family transcriptional regulator
MKATAAISALAALAHEHRLAVYRTLVVAGPAGIPAGLIARKLKLAPSSLSFHLQQLQGAGLITQERHSRQLIYAAMLDSMNELVAYLTKNCCAGADSLTVAADAG